MIVEDKLEMLEMVTRIVRALVDLPEAVHIESGDKGEGTVFRVRVAAEDVGKVIGKEGRNARSIRTLLAAVSMKYRHSFTLVVVDGHALADSVVRSVPESANSV